MRYRCFILHTMPRGETAKETSAGVAQHPRCVRRRSPAPVVGGALLLAGLAVLTGWLSFRSGGFLAGETAIAALLTLAGLLLWVMLSPQPVAGLGSAGMAGIAGFGLFATWTLGSAWWSDAPARAQIEFVRALLYLGAFALMACLPRGRANAAWLLRLVAGALALAVIAGLLGRLQPGLIEAAAARGEERLAWPLGYWNALGLAGTLAILAGLHLSSDLREARVVRVVSAAAIPALAVAVYLTLSRGALVAGAVGLGVLALLGWSRGMATALAAIVPFTVYALLRAYDAPALFDEIAGDAASERQAAALTTTVAIACAGAGLMRAAALALDARLQGSSLWRPWSGRRKAGALSLLTVAAVGTALTVGAVGLVERQWTSFTEAPTVEVTDQRDRLTQASANGRIEHWTVAVDAWREAPLRGTGAGTYVNTWALDRATRFSVLDAHSLYLEVLSELGVVGLATLGVALFTPLAALVRRRSEDRLLWTAVLALVLTWLVRAGIDWDWEMPALTLPIVALMGAACARDLPRVAGRYARSRTLRVLAGLALLLLMITPWRVMASQGHLEEALEAFQRGDCATTIDSSLSSIEALDSRPAGFELLGYCDARAGRTELGIRMLQAAVRRDPRSWEVHYGLGLVRGVAGLDPRPPLRRARRLNPLDPRIAEALERLDSDRPRVWRREAQRLPLIVPGRRTPAAGREQQGDAS
jgi:hypothetical protein